jgi:hypothetical protein
LCRQGSRLGTAGPRRTALVAGVPEMRLVARAGTGVMSMNRAQLIWHTRSYEANKVRERLVMALVWRLPRWLIYWSAIRLMAHATTGRYGSQVVPDLTVMDALERWDW